MPALDSLKALWIIGVFVSVFLWLPAHLFSDRRNSSRVIRIAGNLVRTVLCVTVLVFLLTTLKILGAMTIILLLMVVIAAGWFRRRAGTRRRLLTNLQAAAVNVMRQVETQSLGLFLLPSNHSISSAGPRLRLHVNRWLKILEGHQLLAACSVVVLGITVALQSEHAVSELRFDQPDEYSALFRARELMVNIHPAGRPFVFPAMIASTSLLASTDPMQVARFLKPAIGLSVVLATGLLIQVCANVRVACIAAIYCLGAAAFPPTMKLTGATNSTVEKIDRIFSDFQGTRAGPEFMLSVLFLILALVFLADWHRHSRSWVSLLDFACCLLLTGMMSQVLLFVLAIVAAVLLLRPMVGLFAFAALCYGWFAWANLSRRLTVPDEVRVILPVAGAVLVGCFVALIERKLLSRAPAAEGILLAACLCVAVIWLRPQRLLTRCLEYDAAARATQEIAYRFPRQTWVVAAPTEQLAETFGLGGHEDLARFVEKYRNQVSSPEFRFQDARDLFVYVEKRPFQIFSREPENVSFSILTDPTYINYRSPGGRASLESAALQLCEDYRQHHSNADIFFENEVLRIYHIDRRRSLDAKGEQ